MTMDPPRASDDAATETRVASILLVDDHPANLVALEAILSPLGQRLVRASSGEEALRCVLAEDFAVILMDVHMPGLNGFDTGALIHARPQSRDVPIIFVSAVNTEHEHIFRGYEHGAVDYVLKPYDPQILRAKVGAFVELYRRRQELKAQEALLRARERREMAMESERRLRRLVDLIPICVWAAKPDGAVHYANRASRTYSYKAPQDDGSEADFIDIADIHPDDREAVREAWQEALTQRRGFDMQLRLKRQGEGGYRWHLGRVVPEWSTRGELVGWIATATDVDDQRRAEEALTALLARERDARADAEAANRVKDEFLATVSHELRTPLTAILGWVTMLRRRQIGHDQTQRALETIERNARAQAKLIEDILDVSRIITGKLRLQLRSMDLPAVIGGAVDAVRPAADAKGVELVTNLALSPPDFVGDADRLQQVAWNLVMNAIKFTPEGGRVTVSMERVGSHITLTVADTGKGIPQDFLPHVFERFRQADSSSRREHGGLGLGLAIVRHIVELHGGSVRADSAGEGRGTTFTVTLPCLMTAGAFGSGGGTVAHVDGEPYPGRATAEVALEPLQREPWARPA